MKKLIKINEEQKGEYSIEEVINMYKPYIKQESYKAYKMLKSFGEDHSLFIELEDLEQMANMHLINAYENYDINYKSKKADTNNPDEDNIIGFFSLLEKHVTGGLKRYCRDILKLRRKDYNIFEIKMSYLDQTVPGKGDGDKETVLSEILEVEDKDYYEDIDNKLELDQFLSLLDEKSKGVVENYFLNNKTQIQIAEMFNISQVQVSRILSRSIKKMKAYAEQHKTKESEIMGRNKNRAVNYNHLVDYLHNSIDKERSLNSAITNYCNANNVTLEDAYGTLERRKASFEKIKALYDNKKSSNKKVSEEIKEIIKPIEVEKEKSAPVVVKETKVNHNKEIVMKEVNVLKDINILNLTADVNGLSVNFSPNGIDLCDVKLTGLKVDDLVKLQENIQKVIEINNTLYK